MRDESRSETMEESMTDEARMLRIYELLAALKEIDAIATGKQAKAIIRAQQVARAAITRDREAELHMSGQPTEV